MNRIYLLIGMALMLYACGGTHSPWSSSGIAPAAVTALAGNAGDGAISLGWNAPTTGSAPLTYRIDITPSSGSIQVIQNGTAALVRGLSNGTSYTFSITASNSAGDSPATTIQLQPAALNSGGISAIIINGNTSGNDSSGIFDPSLLRMSDGTIWLAYSIVDYHGTPQIKAVSTSLAVSSDGGQTFNYVSTIGNSTSATVTDTSGSNVCGNNSCNGYWAYEVPFMVDDVSDPDSSRRFKLFAHKYFLYPPNTQNSTAYALGAIVMWTAATPNGVWSAEQRVLGWNTTPPELTALRNINSIDPALSNCVIVSEGSATTFKGALDFVFACSYIDGATPQQKIVQLRSTDHANTFSYVNTLLSASDASTFGALYFSAPALIATESAAPLLIATPVINRNILVNGSSIALDAYSGCIALPIADEQTGTLFRSNNAPLSILQIPLTANRLNGACSWERGLSAIGILMSEADASASSPQFNVMNTAKNF